MIYDDGTMDVLIDGKPARVPFVVRSDSQPNVYHQQPVFDASREMLDFTCLGDDRPRFVTLRTFDPPRVGVASMLD